MICKFSRLVSFLGLIAIATQFSACSPSKETKKSKTITCVNDEIKKQYQQKLENMLSSAADERLQLINENISIDKQKIIGGFQKINLQLNIANTQEVYVQNKDNSVNCRAQLTINLNTETTSEANKYSSLIYAPNSYEAELNSAANANLISIGKDGKFIQTLNYTITNTEKNEIKFNDVELSRMSQTLLTALLPYGIKDKISLGEVSISRNDAIEQLQQPINNNEEQNNQDAITELVKQQKMAESHNELQDLKNEMNQLWEKLDPVIQQNLETEQRAWVRNTKTNCSKKNEQKAIECNINLYKKRISYLREFSID